MEYESTQMRQVHYSQTKKYLESMTKKYFLHSIKFWLRASAAKTFAHNSFTGMS